MSQFGNRAIKSTGDIFYYVEDDAADSAALGWDGATNVLCLNVDNAINQSPNSTTAKIAIDPAVNGNITIIPDGSGVVVTTTSTANIARQFVVSNTDNTGGATSSANVQVTVGGANVGDPTTTYTVTGATSFTTGIDNSAADSFKISQGTALGTSDKITINPTANGDITIDPNGDGALVLASGNFEMPSTTSSTNGVIEFGGDRFVHRYGTANNFIGTRTGNFALTGIENTGLGHSALTALTTGSYNTAIGVDALDDTAGGSGNVALGAHAFNDGTTGSYNTVIGTFTSGAGSWNGSYNVVVNGGSNGIGLLPLNGAESSNVLLNNIGVLGESNTLRIGTTGAGNGQQSRAFIAGVDGVNVGSVAKVLTMASEQVGTATITAGTNVTVTPGANTITIAASSSSIVSNYVEVLFAASPYSALSTDYYISADTTGGAITIRLPNAPSTGRVFVVKDQVGNAAAVNITVTTVGGAVNIDGATSFVMNANYQSAMFIFGGAAYEVF